MEVDDGRNSNPQGLVSNKKHKQDLREVGLDALAERNKKLKSDEKADALRAFQDLLENGVPITQAGKMVSEIIGGGKNYTTSLRRWNEEEQLEKEGVVKVDGRERHPDLDQDILGKFRY